MRPLMWKRHNIRIHVKLQIYYPGGPLSDEHNRTVFASNIMRHLFIDTAPNRGTMQLEKLSF